MKSEREKLEAEAKKYVTQWLETAHVAENRSIDQMTADFTALKLAERDRAIAKELREHDARWKDGPKGDAFFRDFARRVMAKLEKGGSDA